MARDATISSAAAANQTLLVILFMKLFPISLRMCDVFYDFPDSTQMHIFNWILVFTRGTNTSVLTLCPLFVFSLHSKIPSSYKSVL